MFIVGNYEPGKNLLAAVSRKTLGSSTCGMMKTMKNASPLSPADRSTLLTVARDSIRHGLDHGSPLPVNAEQYPEALQAIRATFVTLNLGGALRGCIGHLDGVMPLVKDVAENAFGDKVMLGRIFAVQALGPHLELHVHR